MSLKVLYKGIDTYLERKSTGNKKILRFTIKENLKEHEKKKRTQKVDDILNIYIYIYMVQNWY